MKRQVLLIAFLLSVAFIFSQDDVAQYSVQIINFINLVKANDIDGISQLTAYPLQRQYPLPSIKNEEEFCTYYEVLFDDYLRETIISSKVTENWGTVGWRGIIFKRGLLWLDRDGRLIAVNYQSDEEKQIRYNIIERDRSEVHISLREFEEPIIAFHTGDYLIRIDDTVNGYRYTSWFSYQTKGDKPSIIIEHGVVQNDGSGGNHQYIFKNNGYIYTVYVERLASKENSGFWIEVSYNGVVLLRQQELGGDS